MFAGARAVDEVQVRGWIHVLDFLQGRVRAAEGRSGVELLGVVAAITERSRQQVALFTRLEVDFRLRQDELRVAAASRGLELLESGAIPIEAATLPLLTAVSPSEHVPRILRVLAAEVEAGRGDTGASARRAAARPPSQGILTRRPRRLARGHGRRGRPAALAPAGHPSAPPRKQGFALKQLQQPSGAGLDDPVAHRRLTTAPASISSSAHAARVKVCSLSGSKLSP